MDAQSYTAQERRAANQVWAAAGAYGFEPLFLARYTDGTTDFYMNTVVGLIHKYYGDALIRSVFDAWDGDLRQTMLDDMTWLYLENAAYRLELPRRPVLEALRHAHADYFFAIQYKLSRQEWMAKNQLVYTMQAARWRRVLGRADPVMTPYESGLAAALAPEHVPEPEQLKAEILSIYAKFNLFDGTVHQRAALHLHLDGLLAKLATKAMPTQMIKTDRVTVEHSSSVDAVGGGLAVDKRRAHITLKQNAAQDRAYIESCFGRSLYPPERLRKAEQELCVGDHLGCHLWFSAGVPSPEQAPTPEAKHLAEQAELQADRNRAYYAKNRELHRSVVLRLLYSNPSGGNSSSLISHGSHGFPYCFPALPPSFLHGFGLLSSSFLYIHNYFPVFSLPSLPVPRLSLLPTPPVLSFSPLLSTHLLLLHAPALPYYAPSVSHTFSDGIHPAQNLLLTVPFLSSSSLLHLTGSISFQGNPYHTFLQYILLLLPTNVYFPLLCNTLQNTSGVSDFYAFPPFQSLHVHTPVL